MKTFLPVLVISLFVLGSCNNPKTKVKQDETQDRFGPEYNPERIKRNITNVPDDYQPIPQSDNGILWVSSNRIKFYNAYIPYHDEKFVKFDRSGIQSEEDDFYSGEMYDGINPEVYMGKEKKRIKLSITYNYSDKPSQNEGVWKCLLEDRDDPLRITITQADSVLKSWGINRLNPETKKYR